MRYLFVLLSICVSHTLISQNELDPSSPLSIYDISKINLESTYHFLSTTSKDEVSQITLADQELYLHSTNILSPQYRAVDHNGNDLEQETPLSFEGHTRYGSPVNLVISPEFILASIDIGSDKVWIEPASLHSKSFDKNAVVSYLGSSVKETSHGTCGATEAHRVIDQEKKKQKKISRRAMNGTCYEVEYGICHDYSMITQLGSSADVEAFGIFITMEMNDLYDNQFADIIYFQISGQYLSTCSTCDPWTSSTNSSTVLNDFRQWANSNLASSPINIPHDNATLWTNRNFDGSTIGVGYLGAMCGGSRYNTCEHQSTSTNNRRLVAHEVGHNFDLGHVSGAYIMSGNVSTSSDNFSPTSISAIENYYPNLSCLDSPCNIGTPSISWASDGTVVNEHSFGGTPGACGQSYQDIDLVLERSNFSTDNITVAINANTTSSSVSAEDYELLTTSITFSAGSVLSQNVTVRVYDDAIAESDEWLALDLSIVSGNATLGAFSTHILDIVETSDEISPDCCSGGNEVTYLSSNYNYTAFFAGNNPQFKSRFVMSGSALQALGLSAGPIDGISLNVSSKNSTGPFNGYRIGMTHTSGNTVPSTWLTTTEVYNADVTTTIGWNDFDFSTPFIWDGSSSIYVDLCFNNGSTTVGADALSCAITSGNTGSYVWSYSGMDVCTATVLGTSNFNVCPVTKIRASGGAKIEASATTLVGSSLGPGETAHFYSNDQKAILSLINTGTSDLGCIDVQVASAGNGKVPISGTSSERSAKTFYVGTDNSGPYQVQLHYLDAELSTWGGSTLQIAQSTVPFSSANSSDIIALQATESPFAGADSGATYTASASGDGFFAITSLPVQAPPTAMTDGNLVIGGEGNGVILHSPDGSPYLVRATTSGALLVTDASPLSSDVKITDANLYVGGNNSLYLMQQNGIQYSLVNVTDSGQLSISSQGTTPLPFVMLAAGNLELTSSGKGIILSSPNGTCFQLSVLDGGATTISGPVPCP